MSDATTSTSTTIPRRTLPPQFNNVRKRDGLKTGSCSCDPIEDFCEATSFRHLLPRYDPPINRIFWLLVLLTFTCITIYQIIEVLEKFTSRPTTVNIDKKYPDSLDFPVVTICNSMTFRTSEVHPKSIMHRIISEIYETPELNATVALKYEKVLSTYDTEKYLKRVAFDKGDMITKCSWQGTPCSPDDFEPVVLGSRICYAFNTGLNGSTVRKTALPGGAYGLELTLNAEDYEEMAGPHDTLGILIGLSNQNRTPTAKNTFNTMTGSSTKIGIRQTELNHLKGKTCDEGSLKYSKVAYSRDACIIDQKVDNVKESCGCYPYFIDDRIIKRSEKCNLYKHFSCAENKFEESPQISHEQCPQECFEKRFHATVSQSAISWERSKASLSQDYAKKRNLEERVIKAVQHKYRHDPQRNDTLRQHIERLRNSSDDLVTLIHQINNLSCSESLNLPPADALPNIGEQFQEFVLQVSASPNSYEKSLDGELKSLSNETKILLGIFEGNTAIVADVGNDTIISRTADLGYIAENGLFRLTTLNQWVNALVNIKRLQTQWSNKYHEIGTQSWYKVLEANETEWLSQIEESGQKVDYNGGCLSENIYLWEDGSDIDNARNISSIDMLTCFQYYFAGRSMRIQETLATSIVLSFTNEHMTEDDLLFNECNDLLCNAISDFEASNCKISIVDIKGYITPHLRKMSQLIQGCFGVLEEFKEEMGNFTGYYGDTVVHTFAKLSETVAAYRNKAEFIQTTLDKPVWPLDPHFAAIIDNVTGYESDGLPLLNLSRRFVYNYSIWVHDAQDVGANAARQTLKDLIFATEQMSNFSALLQHLYNNTDGGNGTQDGMFALFSNNLWQNSSISRLDEISECIAQLKNETEEFVVALPKLVRRYKEDIGIITGESRTFLREIQVNEGLFRRDFMTVTIYFTQISVQVIKQEYSYTFWSLLSDLGGTAELWLGLCFTAVVEMITIIIRYTVRCLQSIARNRIYESEKLWLRMVVPQINLKVTSNTAI